MSRTELGLFAACNTVVRYGGTFLVLAGPALATEIDHPVPRMPHAEFRLLASDNTKTWLRGTPRVPARLAADVGHPCRSMSRTELGLPVAFAKNPEARARRTPWLLARLRPYVDRTWPCVPNAKLRGLAAGGPERRSSGATRLTAPLGVAEVDHPIRRVFRAKLSLSASLNPV